MHTPPIIANDTDSGRFSIVRHPDWSEINPFDVIQIPVRDIETYSPDALVVFARGCQEIYHELDHPVHGLGINPTRIAEVNNAMTLLESADAEQVKEWAAQFITKKSNEDILLHEQIQNYLKLLIATADKMDLVQRAHAQTFTKWFEEQFNSLLNNPEQALQNKELSFQHVDSPKLLASSEIERLKTLDKSVLSHSNLAEQIILNGQDNPFNVIPITESLLEALIKNKEEISIKESFKKIKRLILKLLHPDVHPNASVDDFMRINQAFNVIEGFYASSDKSKSVNKSEVVDESELVDSRELDKIGDEKLKLIGQSYLAQQKKIRTESLIPLVKQIIESENLADSKFNDILKSIQRYHGIMDNLVHIADLDSRQPGTQTYQSLMFFAGRVFPVMPGVDRLDMKNMPSDIDSYLYVVDKNGVLYRSQTLLKTPKITGISEKEEIKQTYAGLMSDAKLIACGYLCGSITRIAQGDRQYPYIGSAALPVENIDLLEGISSDITIPLISDEQESRIARPLLFITTDTDKEIVVLHPYHSVQYKPNVDKFYVYQVARSACIEILDRECAFRSVRKYSFGGCVVESNRSVLTVRYKPSSSDEEKIWNIDDPSLDNHTESDILLLQDLLHKLQPIFLLKKTILLCNKLLRDKQKVTSKDGSVSINLGSKFESELIAERIKNFDEYLDPTENLEVRFELQGQPYVRDLLAELRALKAGESSIDMTHAGYAHLYMHISKHFKA
jgi:hypothetical protein